jgi:hypothetical protein
MARLKLYYPVDEITNNLYTYGSELMTEDNKEYVGPFHRYVTGEVYTGTVWNVKTSKKLIAFKQQTTQTIYNKLKPDIQLRHVAPKRVSVQITSNDIAKGSIQRYFICKQNEPVIFEIDALQYQYWGNNQIDNKAYIAVQLTWTITGTIQDVKKGNVVVPGVTTKNLQQIKNATRKMPQVSSILTNPIEFYTDTDYIKPVDINGLK